MRSRKRAGRTSLNREKTLRISNHIVSSVILAVSLLLGGLFFLNSYFRLIESFYDVGTSLIYAFGGEVEATVTEVSKVGFEKISLLPSDMELSKIKFELYGKMLINGTSFKYYGYKLSGILYGIVIAILFALPIIVILGFILYLLLRKLNMDDTAETVPYRAFKVVSKNVYIPVKKWVIQYSEFFKEKFGYKLALILIWIFNFNLPAIAVEGIAYYVYFASSFNLANLYMQFYKMLVDLSVMVRAIPKWIWAVIGLYIYDVWRKHIAYKKLVKVEEENEEFVKSLAVSNLIVAPMNMKKTTFLTDISITANKVFREEAYKRLVDNDMKFPHFPWIRFERCIKAGIETHSIYNFATCKKFVDTFKLLYRTSNKLTVNMRIMLMLRLKEKYRYGYADELFGYDVAKYGDTYYNELEVHSLFDVLETYAKLYFIYIFATNMIVSSYAIRTDEIIDDEGNFPIWDTDFFKRDRKHFENNSTYSHIIDYEAFRLGKHLVENDKFKDSIDFGIAVISEVGKERGNQFTQSGSSKDETANQKNDLLSLDTKMSRHRATVDNYPFTFRLSDEQRPEDLNANERQCGDVIRITGSSDFKIITPLFALDELVYMAVNKIFGKAYKKIKNKKANTLLSVYLFKKFYHGIWSHYTKIFNNYSVSTLKLNRGDGYTDKSDRQSKDVKYKLAKKKIHSGRFATDAYAGFYYEKTRCSAVGLGDTPMYAGKTATFKELLSQRSYFVNQISKYFYGDKVA